MSLRELLQLKSGEATTPAYYFDTDVFLDRIYTVKEALGDIPLTYSIKANPFLLGSLSDELSHVEVCSPGELTLCKKYGIPGGKIIYSGVNKGIDDITEAIEYDVDILTAESKRHIELEQQACAALNKNIKVILRLTSGNQFGMSEEDILTILATANKYPNIDFYGIHYFSGTQKKIRSIEKDIAKIKAFLKRAGEECGFEPKLVEMGGGFKTEYYEEDCEGSDMDILGEASAILKEFAEEVPLGIELGRFLAGPCGTYLSKVCDIKKNDTGTYVILDGGINHLVYYGQNMAMKIPEMEVLSKELSDDECGSFYCLCGSLCTVADVLVREVELPKLQIGDTIAFHRCGAYSVAEGLALFLSRELPRVFLYSDKDGMKMVRDTIKGADINS